MIYIGCHLSVTRGYEAMGRTMLEFGGNTFAWFTRNPRGGKTRDVDPEDAAALNALLRREGFGPMVAHGSYTMNLCAANPVTRANGIDMLARDLERMALFPGSLYNFHPGSHVGQGTEAGIIMIADMLNGLLRSEQTTTVLLETMAGKGSEVGGRFEELREILDRVNLKEKMGVCLDTCHVHDAGYDIVNHPDEVLAEFDRVIGLDRLRAVHVNDSKNPLGARKDRHEKIGEGFIGTEAILRLMRHPALRDLPFNLETPNELDGYEREIRMLKELY